MWVLESISEIPLKRALIVLLSTLGAAFLLLAHFFSMNPLMQPLLYSILALDLFLLWRKNHKAVHGAVLILLAF
ncbi:MAG TPA: hypothetical protein VJ521_09360, partial [Acidobacteriota bacterium]|nr:hypothetical protein [Acidobacteriota bacterium]